MKCPVCDEEFKNLGAHMRAHPGAIIPVTREEFENFTVDVPTDKRLSELIDAMKDLLRPYQNQIKVCYEEEGGMVKSIEFTARIQLRR